MVAVDCVFGVGVGAADMQGGSFLVGICSVNATVGVARGLSLASSTDGRSRGGDTSPPDEPPRRQSKHGL